MTVGRLRSRVTEKNYDMWLRPIELLSFDGAVLRLRAPAILLCGPCSRTFLISSSPSWGTAILIPGWKELEGRPFMWPMRATYDPLVVCMPQSWLLREGWKVCGPISAHDVPSKRA